MKFIEDQHRDYQKSKLDEQSLTAKPFELFTKWFELAKNANIVDPNAFILSTSTTDGKPSSRVVLLKSYDENGFVFFSIIRAGKQEKLMRTQCSNVIFLGTILKNKLE
jgi:pyridoxamine 5'-phosphate oxidase